MYGDSLRQDAGFVKVFKKVARKNARLLETRAGRHGPEIRRVAREVKGTFDKVYEETAEVVEEFLAKCMRMVLPDVSSVRLKVDYPAQRARRFRKSSRTRNSFFNNPERNS